jgi:MerR family transcriptional regulator, redox-sensitive transcriptional activator SoxR
VAVVLDSSVADELAISDVARVFGLRTSAIRYYEQIGLLPRPLRRNGQRRYDRSVLFQLAIVQRAREIGFSLDQIRELFFGFRPGTPPPKRWRQLSERKAVELRNRMKRLKIMETLLKRMQNCQCGALEECGEKLLAHCEIRKQRGKKAEIRGQRKLKPYGKVTSDE